MKFGWLLLLLLLVADTASAQRPPGDGFPPGWYGGLRIGAVSTDDGFDNDGRAWFATVGRNLGEKYAIEVEVSGDELDFGVDYGLKHRALAVNHITINRDPLWDPYFLVGVGVIEFDAPPGLADRSGQDVMFNLGIGGQWELMLPQRAFVRADLRLRYDFNETNQPGQDGFGDGILSVGLTIPFGR
jgi:hypothetical protein